jgi:WD40 repeat protein
VVNPAAVGSGILVPIVCPANRDTLLALGPRGTCLAVSCERSDEVQVWEPRSGREVTRCMGFQHVSGIEFLSTEVLLVTTWHGCFRCDLRRGEREALVSEGWLTRTTVSPNGRLLAIGVQGGIDLYDVRKRKVLHRLSTAFTYRPIGTRAAFSAGGRYVAAELSDENYQPILVGVWDAHSGSRQRIFDTEAHALAFRGDTLALAVADDHGRILLYEPDQGETPAKELPVQGVGRELQFRDEGRTLAVVLDNGEFVQFETETGRVLRRILPPADPKPLWRSITSEDWSQFAGVAEGGVVVWPGDRAEQAAPADRPRD